MRFNRPIFKYLLNAGWVVAFGLALILAYLFPRIHLRILEQPRNWSMALQWKKAELGSVKWNDARPLLVGMGDSHIEMGNWYMLFNGAVAVRNCGMSMATIRDVQDLVNSIPEKRPHIVMLMCGINSLCKGQPPETCLRDYQELVGAVRSHLNPERILILAVMPVRQTLLDPRGGEINQRVSELNAGLSLLSKRTDCEYVNVNESIIDPNGGLACRLTSDGLHLNAMGYRVFASAILKEISQ